MKKIIVFLFLISLTGMVFAAVECPEPTVSLKNQEVCENGQMKFSQSTLYYTLEKGFCMPKTSLVYTYEPNPICQICPAAVPLSEWKASKCAGVNETIYTRLIQGYKNPPACEKYSVNESKVVSGDTCVVTDDNSFILFSAVGIAALVYLWGRRNEKR